MPSFVTSAAVLISAWCLATSPGAARAQEPDTTDASLAALVREAVGRSPRVAAAEADARSVGETVSQAGAWEDPVLTVGFMNLPTTSFDFADDFMTMKVAHLGQTVPLPGQIGHRREAASLSAEAAAHLVDAARIRVVAKVKRAYAELYYRDRALGIVDRNLAVLRGLEEVTRARYATGVGHQPAVLWASLEIDGLEAQRVVLAESRRAALAQLNAARDRPAGTPVGATSLPERLLALLPSRQGPPGFPSALKVGGRGRALALPPLDSLVARAVAWKPELRAHVARIRAQEETVDLARARRWPAPRLAVGYGQREGFPDMLTATLSFSLPVFAGAKQDAAVREEEEALARERSLHDRMVREIERDVTAAHAAVTDALGRLALYERGILARARANLEATIAAYRSGAEDFLALLDSQTTLYRHELDYHRRLADLLAAWAGLEWAAGGEITP